MLRALLLPPLLQQIFTASYSEDDQEAQKRRVDAVLDSISVLDYDQEHQKFLRKKICCRFRYLLCIFGVNDTVHGLFFTFVRIQFYEGLFPLQHFPAVRDKRFHGRTSQCFICPQYCEYYKALSHVSRERIGLHHPIRNIMCERKFIQNLSTDNLV